MPKKPPPNPFYYYMKEKQDEMKNGGQRVPSMREMPALASPEWNRMTPEQKAPYEEMAKAFKRNRANTDDGRFTSDGIPIQVLKKQEEEVQESVRAIETAVRNLVKTFLDADEIAQSSFFIMGFNILVGTLEHLYLPNEIGIVECSIREGIKSEYHAFIDPGPIPIGYMSAAKTTSETVHEIPVSGFLLATSNYKRLYQDIKDFLGLQTQTETRYVFCHPKEVDQFQRCLSFLKEKSRSNGKEEVVVASLAVLVAELKAAAKEEYKFQSSVVEAISTNSFDYSPNTLCSYHEEKDNKYCALGYCKRLSYVLADILCKPYNVEPTSKHFPERVAAAQSTVWEPKRDPRPVTNHVDVPLKPVVPHIPTTIVRNIRSKFDDGDQFSVTPSAVSETSSVISESIDLEDEDAFPSLTSSVRDLSVSSVGQTVSMNSGTSWAQVSNKKPLRSPRSLPESFRLAAAKVPDAAASGPAGFGRGAGIGRGRGQNFGKN